MRNLTLIRDPDNSDGPRYAVVQVMEHNVNPVFLYSIRGTKDQEHICIQRYEYVEGQPVLENNVGCIPVDAAALVVQAVAQFVAAWADLREQRELAAKHQQPAKVNC